MKKYFISVQVYGGLELNKFIAGIIEADLAQDHIPDIAKKLIISEFKNINIEKISIQVIAFNNID